MSEERRQLNIAFGIFAGAVIVVAIIKPIIALVPFIKVERGKKGVQVKFFNPISKDFVDITLSILYDTACIFVILYFQHINFRP